MRSIPDPGFSGDAGGVDPAVATALAAYDADPEAGDRAALAVLQDARVLVPVLASAQEASSDMATVLMRGRDGRTALLAFTGTESLQRWNTDARPVPVTLRDAARAALQDGAEALLVAVAGPVQFVVEDDDLRALADGERLVGFEDRRWGWARQG